MKSFESLHCEMWGCHQWLHRSGMGSMVVSKIYISCMFKCTAVSGWDENWGVFTCVDIPLVFV